MNWYSFLKWRTWPAIIAATESPPCTPRLPPSTKSTWTSTTSSAFLMLTLALMASVIVAGARTPFGRFGGAFKDVPATSLGAHAIRAALERSGVQGKDVDYVIMGQVLQAGAGPNPPPPAPIATRTPPAGAARSHERAAGAG